MFTNVDGWTIATVVLGIAATFFAVYLALAKKKFGEALDLLQAALKLGRDTLAFSADKVYTDEEKAQLKLDWANLEAAAKALAKKEEPDTE